MLRAGGVYRVRAGLAGVRLPQQVLTDDGKQFTGRFGRPRPAEVLFERIWRRNGSETDVRDSSPRTSTGWAGTRSSSSGQSVSVGTSRSGRSSFGSGRPMPAPARALDGHHDRASVPGRGAPEDGPVSADHRVPYPAPV